MASDRQQPDAETRIRAAIVQLLGGDIPDGLKCDVKSLCVLAGVPRATLYRTYPHLKAEFDRQRDAAQENGMQPDPRLARIDQCKTETNDLRVRLASCDREISELKRFRDTAVSRLTAQHDEITALRTQPRTPERSKIRSLPSR
jgi:predicted nuclease with TOPRIM domain